jgi:uncharacterized paraquat-inducible protein A
MKAFRVCPIHNLAGLVGTAMKKEFTIEPEIGRCSSCKATFDLPLAEMKIGDWCKRCGIGTIKPVKVAIEYCPDCRKEVKE